MIATNASCPNPPYFPNGTWCGWQSQINSINNSTDPVSGTVGVAFHAIPILAPIFCCMLYVYLWILFQKSPSRFKLVGISAIVMVVSIILAAGGFPVSAVMNFVVFALSYFLSFLFRR
jgi:hypothetical protein